MIPFRCGRCAEALRADNSIAGRAVKCPRCGHVNVCPPAAASRPQAAAAALARRSDPSARSGAQIVWIVAGVALLVFSSFMAWTQLNESTTSAASASLSASSMSPGDALQKELLTQDVDKPGDPALLALYQEVNAGYFASGLPAMPVMWEAGLARVGDLAAQKYTLEGMFGHIGSKTAILLNPDLQNDDAALRRALCHEMVHAYLYTTGDHGPEHGPTFQTVLKRLSQQGAFEGIVSTEEDRAQLRTWLDEESKRIDDERKFMDEIGADLENERAAVEQALKDVNDRKAGAGSVAPDALADVNARLEAYNRRANEANARLARDRADLDHFNDEVQRYNLMLVYPDGFDETAALKPKAKPAER